MCSTDHFNSRWPIRTWNVNNAPAPSTLRSLRRIKKKFTDHGTVQDRRKKRASAREGQEEKATPGKIEEVSALMQMKMRNLGLCPC